MPAAPGSHRKRFGSRLAKVNGLYVLEDEDGSALGGIRARGGAVDPIAIAQLDKVAEPLRKEGAARQAEDLIKRNGWSDEVDKAIERLKRSGLDEVSRLLLSDPDIQGAILLEAFTGGAETKAAPARNRQGANGESGGVTPRVEPSDTSGVVAFVRRTVESQRLRGAFESHVVDAVFRRNNIDPFAGDTPTKPELERQGRLLTRVRHAGLSLAPGTLEPQILRLHQEEARAGQLPARIMTWANEHAIPAYKLTDPVIDRMVSQLQGYGIPFDKTSSTRKYDEYFAIAYDTATRAGGDNSDPIQLSRAQPLTLSPWDFQVDTFETAEEQGVLSENIMAAGALDYVWWLGEVLGVFKLVDALVLRWAAGMLDVSDPTTSSRLYRYWQLREDRVSPEERGMLYKRVHNRGDTELLSRMVVNEQFEPLWGRLMERVAEYTDRAMKARAGDVVPRVGIERATQDLQINLTEHMTGMAHLQVTDMYMQLKEAFELLGSDEVTAQLSMGRRRSVWSTIERLSREELRTAPDVAGHRTLAVEGNKVYQWIADFQRGAADSDFETFRDAAEAWIIAAGTVDTQGGAEEEDERDDGFEDEPALRFGDEDEEGSW